MKIIFTLILERGSDKMNKKIKALKSAFPTTIPIMLGYLFVGIAFGMLFQEKGYNFLWAALMSILVYAGSMQFVAINFFTGGVSLFTVALMTFLVNIRHVFYGLSMLDKFREMRKKKLYMIFSLTDETYSLLCSVDIPPGVSKEDFLFSIALLNQLYWIVGSIIGSLAGSLIFFNTSGIDFAMTALFVVIFTEQWLSSKNHLPALIGFIATLAFLIILGPDSFLIPSMITILLLLLAFKKVIMPKDDEQNNLIKASGMDNCPREALKKGEIN